MGSAGPRAASETRRAAHRAAVDHRWFAAEGLGARPPRVPRRRRASPTGRPYHSIRPLGRRRGGPTPCRPARASGAETGASRDGARAAAARPSGASDEHRRRARPRGMCARPRSSARARRQRCARGRPDFVRESVSVPFPTTARSPRDGGLRTNNSVETCAASRAFGRARGRLERWGAWRARRPAQQASPSAVKMLDLATRRLRHLAPAGGACLRRGSSAPFGRARAR